jgi:hypothetical protein
VIDLYESDGEEVINRTVFSTVTPYTFEIPIIIQSTLRFSVLEKTIGIQHGFTAPASFDTFVLIQRSKIL